MKLFLTNKTHLFWVEMTTLSSATLTELHPSNPNSGFNYLFHCFSCTLEFITWRFALIHKNSHKHSYRLYIKFNSSWIASTARIMFLIIFILLLVFFFFEVNLSESQDNKFALSVFFYINKKKKLHNWIMFLFLILFIFE